MPFGDGTGPLGQGRRQGLGQGVSRGQGRGMGRQAGFRQGNGTGICRRFRVAMPDQTLSTMDNSQAINDEIAIIETQLDNLKERLKQTEGK